MRDDLSQPMKRPDLVRVFDYGGGYYDRIPDSKKIALSYAQFSNNALQKDPSIAHPHGRLVREIFFRRKSVSWAFPVVGGYITSNFGPRIAPYPGASTFHYGMDIGGRGTDWLVRSVGPGTVLAVGYNAYRGKWVAVRHGDGTTTAYQHLARTDVHKGQSVSTGTVLGLMGNTATAIAVPTHLHLEWFPPGRFLLSADAFASVGRAVDPAPHLVSAVSNPTPIPNYDPTPITPITPLEDDMFTDTDRALLQNVENLLARGSASGGGIRGDVLATRADVSTVADLVRALVPAIIEGLPTGTGGLTQAQVTDACVAALRAVAWGVK